MKRKLSKIIIAMSAACYLFSSVTAYAAWTSSGQTDNYVSMGSYKTSIVEEYTQPQHVDPSETVDKIVNVKNSGTVGTFVRVAIEKKIGDMDADGNFVTDETLDPEMILITYNDTIWKDGGDGYFYYLKELKPGETTEEALQKVTPDWFNYPDQTSNRPETVRNMSLVRPGHNFKDIPELRDNLNMHSDRYYRLDPDRPSPTIVNWRKLPLIHPTENRTLTVAEASALMGFDKEFQFHGTLSERQQQCGNGCTHAIGKLIKDTVKKVLVQYHTQFA